VLQLGAQQERLIDGLLTLASSEGGVVQWEPIDLGQVAGTVILARRAETERRGISVESTLLAAPTVGDPNLVESLMANLVDNALRHNTDGGRVEVTTFRRDGRAVLAVNNTGPVIAADEVERLFQPFRQRDDRIGHGDGHGLGLAIVRAIATAHRATMTARARAGGGLEVEVQFPA
jgi:signal transduction histidine kinase